MLIFFFQHFNEGIFDGTILAFTQAFDNVIAILCSFPVILQIIYLYFDTSLIAFPSDYFEK